MLKYTDKRLIIVAIFAVVGLLTFIVGGFFAVKIIFFDIKNKGKVNGVITSLTNNSTTVSYVVNEKEYRKNFSVYSSTYYVGKKVKLYYDINHPNKANLSGMRYLSLIAPGIGILMTGISGVILIFFYMNSDRYKLMGY